MAAKSRVVLVQDKEGNCRDKKLCRFVRDAQENPELKFVKWAHGGSSRWLAIHENRLCEVQRISENRSIFAPGNVVLQDGSILLVTPMDPLFLLLGQFAIWQRKDQFCSLHDVMESAKVNLTSVTRWNGSNISQVCDVEEEDDMDSIRVRCNEDKIVQWLKKKVDRLILVQQDEGSASQQAFTSSFERPPESKGAAEPSKEETKQVDEDTKHKMLQSAILILSEYLDTVWVDALVKSNGMSPTDWAKEKATEKPKPGGDLIAKFDVRQSSNAPAPSKRPASAPAAKPVAKKKPVDTSGMKSIASFFGKK